MGGTGGTTTGGTGGTGATPVVVEDDSGCGCRVPASTGSQPGTLVFFLAGLAGLLRLRRKPE
jgi:MYXO-CTERM domain-containing protein